MNEQRSILEVISNRLKSASTYISDYFHARATAKAYSGANLMADHLTLAESATSAAAAVSSKVTLVGSAGSVFGWLTSNATGMWAGVLIGLLGLLVNLYFKIQDNKRKDVAQAAWMKKMEVQSASGMMPLMDMGDEE